MGKCFANCSGLQTLVAIVFMSLFFSALGQIFAAEYGEFCVQTSRPQINGWQWLLRGSWTLITTGTGEGHPGV